MWTSGHSQHVAALGGCWERRDRSRARTAHDLLHVLGLGHRHLRSDDGRSCEASDGHLHRVTAGLLRDQQDRASCGARSVCGSGSGLIGDSLAVLKALNAIQGLPGTRMQPAAAPPSRRRQGQGASVKLLSPFSTPQRYFGREMPAGHQRHGGWHVAAAGSAVQGWLRLSTPLAESPGGRVSARSDSIRIQ